MYKKQVLKNGLTVLKVPVRGARSVLVDVFIKVGSRQESPRINGISHFLEHLFFKGSAKYPTAQDLSHALDEIGAEYNANTGKEHTQYYIKAAKKHLPFIFDLLTDMLLHPVFDAKEIEREKGVIIEEINMYQDTPMRHVEDVLEEVMWPDQPLGRNIPGTKEVITKITRKNILDYVEGFYQHENMIFSVAGAYDEQELDILIHEFWNKLKNKPFPKWKKAVEKQTIPALTIESKKTEQMHVAVGFRSNYQDTGLFVIQAGVRQGSLNESIKVIMEQLKKIKNEPVPGRELKKAKEYIKGTLTLSLEDSESLLGWYLEQIAFRKRVLEPDQAFEEIDTVTAEDVARVARDIFQEKKLSLAVIGAGKPVEVRKLLKL